MKHTEYIIPIGEDAQDYDEMFIGVIRRQPELVRCKDCKHYYEREWLVGGGSYTTCWYQTIANAQPNDFCSRAERREE